VSTASTRPLYGRGAGSTPAEGSHARSSEERAPSCDGGGRWFESSRAYSREARGRSSAGRASERHSEEARSIRAVRFTSPWCNGSTPSSNLDGPGSNPGGLAETDSESSRAEAVRLSGKGGDPAERSSTPARTATCGSGCTTRPRRHDLLRAGAVPVIDPHRQVAGSSPARSIRAPVAQLAERFRPYTTTAAAIFTAVRRGTGYLQNEHRSSPHDRGTPESRLRAGSGTVIGRAPGTAGRRRVRIAPGALTP
jgi:hypothetical protein